MNTNDHSNLTAYALGELDAEHAEAMAHWIAMNPEAQAEIESLGDLSLHLQNTAPIAVVSLHQHQRESVLNGPQRVRQLVAAAQQKQHHQPLLLPFLQSVARLAAAAVLVLAGYIAGTHFAKPTTSTDIATAPQPVKPAPATVAHPVKPFKAVEVIQPLVVSLPEVKAVHVNVPEKDEPKPVATAEPKVLVAEVKAPMPSVKEPETKLVSPRQRVIAGAFINTARDANAEIMIRPSETRPTAAASGPVAAALIKEQPKLIAPQERPKAPELRIHSWKTEVASCPWDESRRLIRLVVQIPGEQPAAAASAQYPLHVTFDAKYVRSFRALGERSLPSPAADAPAFHVAWYEFIPNGPTTDVARIIGQVTLPNAKFTTDTTGPFDNSTLQIVDRGSNWKAARGDFLYESAVMGFGLLLKGEKDSGSLDHALVLDLANRALASDRNVERVKFTKVVQDAQKSAGL